MKSNFERMIELADEAFNYRNDDKQLEVNDEVIKKLQQLHPSTLSEYDDGNGLLFGYYLFQPVLN